MLLSVVIDQLINIIKQMQCLHHYISYLYTYLHWRRSLLRSGATALGIVVGSLLENNDEIWHFDIAHDMLIACDNTASYVLLKCNYTYPSYVAPKTGRCD